MKFVCVAGTFEGVHRGHEAMLAKAFEIGEKVLVGLTSDDFVKTYKENVSDYGLREKALRVWLDSHGYGKRYEIVPINDPFEPAVSQTDIDALVVSEETRIRGEELNRIRVQHGLQPLELVIVRIVTDASGKKISSGHLFMPESLRILLGKPLGPVVSVFQKDATVITVGDLTTKTALEAGIRPLLMVIDNKIGRKPFPEMKQKKKNKKE